MTRTQMKDLLNTLIESDAAPIGLTLGYVDDSNIVQRDAVVIQEAAPATVKTVMTWAASLTAQQDGPVPVMVSVRHGGLLVC